jgi:hypothetical protein
VDHKADSIDRGARCCCQEPSDLFSIGWASVLFLVTDHFDVSAYEKKGREPALTLTNAFVKVMCEASVQAKWILGQSYLEDCPGIDLRTGSSRTVTFSSK